jgi:hypothetical protein
MLQPSVSRPVYLGVKHPSPRQDFYYCHTVLGLLMWGTLHDERTICHLQLVLVLGNTVILGYQSCGTHDHILLSWIRNTPNLVSKVPVFISPGTGWPSYNPRHWVPFSSPPTTRGDTVEVLEPTTFTVLTYFENSY